MYNGLKNIMTENYKMEKYICYFINYNGTRMPIVYKSKIIKIGKKESYTTHNSLCPYDDSGRPSPHHHDIEEFMKIFNNKNDALEWLNTEYLLLREYKLNELKYIEILIKITKND